MRKRILFFGEAATLSHVVRPWVLATGLDPNQYEVVFCRHPRYDQYFSPHTSVEKTVRLESASSEQFLRNLHQGRAIFDEPTLDRYIQADLALIDEHKPDIVVGDLRLSLLISARLSRVRYLNICNAYWNPALKPSMRLPDIPLRRWLGRALGQRVFELALPHALRWQLGPMNRLARKYGTPRLGGDIREAYTGADFVLYCDLPSLFPDSLTDETHAFIGPVLWTPQWQKPDWWDDLPTANPVVFATLGSSGNMDVLTKILATLSQMPLTTIVSTLGRRDFPRYPNVYYADILPVGLAAAQSALTICNGGSALTYQAIASGSGVLGVPANLDQYLNLFYLKSRGVAELLETPNVSAKAIRSAVEKMLADELFTARVKVMKKEIASSSAAETFNKILRTHFKKADREAA